MGLLTNHWIYYYQKKQIFAIIKEMRKKKQTKNIKKFFVLGIFVVCVVLVLNFISNKKIIPHQNIVDTKISLYSDKNINSSATETNPEFKHLVFDTLPEKKSSLFSHQIAAVFKSLKSIITREEKNKKETKESGSWIWTPIMQMSPNYTESILTEAKINGVNVMYLSIDSYLDIFTMKKGTIEGEELSFSDDPAEKRKYLEALHNKFCGTCHDSSQAFGYLTRCTVCHIGVKGFDKMNEGTSGSKEHGKTGH